MPYKFQLPTTSSLSYSLYLRSESHPSIILAATVQREIVRTALKKHKTISAALQATNLPTVLAALVEYVPYLFALDAGLGRKPVGDEEVDIILVKDFEVEWRPGLASATPGRKPARVNGRGIDYEIIFILTTLAYTYSLLARGQLHSLYASTTPLADQRVAAITSATKYYLQAHTLHEYLVVRAGNALLPTAAVDVAVSTQKALASLAMAEATLLAVLKDDSYPAIVARDRNNNDKDWMIKAPELPRVRALLFARLSLGAAEHAGTARALLGNTCNHNGSRVDDSMVDYPKNLQCTSRAKACRFFGIDAELSGKTGEGIAWLVAGEKELGFKVNEAEGSRIKGLAKLKKDWIERREDKKIEKDGDWGSDAGRLEESRVIEWLEKKWNKENDLISSQRVPPSDPLIAAMPSSRSTMYTPKPYIPPSLDADTLARMRAPPNQEDETLTLVNDSDGSEEGGSRAVVVPGSFPGQSPEHGDPYF